MSVEVGPFVCVGNLQTKACPPASKPCLPELSTGTRIPLPVCLLWSTACGTSRKLFRVACVSRSLRHVLLLLWRPYSGPVYDNIYRTPPFHIKVGPRRVGSGSWGGLAREHHEQDRQLAAKVRSQDSSLRSLRADVSTLRRRLRTQAETLAKQREENTTVRRAAEQVRVGARLRPAPSEEGRDGLENRVPAFRCMHPSHAGMRSSMVPCTLSLGTVSCALYCVGSLLFFSAPDHAVALPAYDDNPALCRLFVAPCTPR